MNNTTKPPASQAPTELDEQALCDVMGGAKTYTGGRFQLDIGKYSVGYVEVSNAPQGDAGTPGTGSPAR